MHLGKICPVLATAVLMAFCGCRKLEPAVPPPLTPAPDAIVRLHWEGKRRLNLTADAYYFTRIWDAPAAVRLQAQTFDKLATAPWRIHFGEALATQIPAGIIRPLLDDLVGEESYLEVRAPTNGPMELAFALHVNPSRAGIWQTNFGVAAQLFAGSAPVPNPAESGWVIRRTNAPNQVMLSRVGDWTLVGVGPENNQLYAEIAARLRQYSVPVPPGATNYWLDANVDLARVVTTFHLKLPVLDAATAPKVTLLVNGDGGNVITRCQLDFPMALPVDLEPWTIPTALIREPLTTFTAVRGFRPWLAASQWWQELPPGAVPNQAFFWGLSSGSTREYFAAPKTDAGPWMNQLTQQLLSKGNPWLSQRGYVSFDPLPTGDGVSWGRQANLLPFLKSVNTPAGAYIYAGLFPDTDGATNAPAPEGMIQDVLHRPNLLYYDWELTGSRLESWFYLSQLGREVSRHALLPNDSASAAWLGTLLPRLGTSATIVSASGTNQLSLLRKSNFGLTAPELHLLVDWLESPRFPLGLYSLLTPPASAPANSGQ